MKLLTHVLIAIWVLAFLAGFGTVVVVWWCQKTARKHSQEQNAMLKAYLQNKKEKE
jgi:uncharacterized membrane protein required for colicin V production